MLVNKGRAEEAMRRFGLDALVAASPVNITYLSDYRCWLDPLFKEYMSAPGGSSERGQSYALLPLEGEPALVVSALFAVNAADAWVRDLRPYGDPGLDDGLEPGPLGGDDRRFYDLLHPPARHGSPAEALTALLAARGLDAGTIGVDIEGWPAREKAQVEGLLPRVRLKDCTNLFRWIRMVKSAEEIARLRRSAEINERAAMDSLALASPGRPMADLIHHYRVRAAELGADFDHFAFTPRGHGIATEAGYVLGEGDVLYTDFGCIYRGYFSDAGVTLALGEAPAGLAARYRALRDAVDAGAEAMRPGARASAVQAAMWRAFTAAGFTTSYPHGHGLGLEVRDYPILTPDNGGRIRDECLDVPSDLPLEAGMVLSLEAGLFASGAGSLQVERTLLVTEGGSEPLTPQDRAEPVRPHWGG